eukprot:GFYU01027802.1.p1 GENE.GFYU01027802.1~~GFYU01027802.1.p1  ORF type:complete len:190 (-),score=8.87 GFYU01027802.1:22-591(-)
MSDDELRFPFADDVTIEYGTHHKIAPHVETPLTVVRAACNMATVNAEDFVGDLGCGGGRFLVTCCQDMHCQGIGYDIHPELLVEAKTLAEEKGQTTKTTFVNASFMDDTTWITDCTMIYCYLTPHMATDQNLVIPLLRFLTRNPANRVVSWREEFFFESDPCREILATTKSIAHHHDEIYHLHMYQQCV